MSKKYGLTKWNSPKGRKWHSVADIDYSILLAFVFGKPVKAEQAFMYFFRRFGLPNTAHDDYKDLCAYLFSTNDKGVIVCWCMNKGDYHFHLRAFADESEYRNYKYKPVEDYHKEVQAAAEKDGLVYFGGHAPFCLWRVNKTGETEFVGNDTQRAAVDEICKDYSSDDEAAWEKIFDRLNQHDKKMREKYSGIARPDIETGYGKDFLNDRHNQQAEAGRKQHEWILTLPKVHFLRRVYFAAKNLFEDWKRPVCIRDQFFDLTCEEPKKQKKYASYTDFTTQLNNKEANNAGN